MSSIKNMVVNQAEKLARRLTTKSTHKDVEGNNGDGTDHDTDYDTDHNSSSDEATPWETTEVTIYDSIAQLGDAKENARAASQVMNEFREAPLIGSTDNRKTLREIFKAYDWELDGQDQVIAAQIDVIRGAEMLIEAQARLVHLLHEELNDLRAQKDETHVQCCQMIKEHIEESDKQTKGVAQKKAMECAQEVKGDVIEDIVGEATPKSVHSIEGPQLEK